MPGTCFSAPYIRKQIKRAMWNHAVPHLCALTCALSPSPCLGHCPVTFTVADLDGFGLPLHSLPNPSPLIDSSVFLLSMYKPKGRGLVYLTFYPQPFARCLSHREDQNMFAEERLNVNKRICVRNKNAGEIKQLKTGDLLLWWFLSNFYGGGVFVLIIVFFFTSSFPALQEGNSCI